MTLRFNLAGREVEVAPPAADMRDPAAATDAGGADLRRGRAARLRHGGLERPRGPVGTPEAVVAQVAAALDGALNAPEVRRRLDALAAGATPPWERGPAAMVRLVAVEFDRWTGIIRAAGIRAE